MKPYFYIVLAYFFGVVKGYAQFDAGYKFDQVIDRIEDFYVDTVNTNDLVETAIIEMLKKLDPHSIYLKKKEAQEMSMNLEGSFDGIGVNYGILNDTMFIISTIADSPCQRAGVQPRDRVVAIQHKPVAGRGVTSKELKDLLTSQKEITLTIVRGGQKQCDVVVLREPLKLKSVDAAYLLSDKIGYIKLNRFAANTVDEFADALNKLSEQGARKLILDLQGNGGGYLRTATRLCDQFLDNQKIIVYTEGINNPRRDYMATSWGQFEHGQMVVLIDEGSASASEIVAGAIQDWDRGIIIGRRSFGKGLVQSTYDLFDSSAIRLTIARYYTPSGRSIQKPYSDGVDEYRKEVKRRLQAGELTNLDSIKFVDSLRYSTLQKDRTVYGGGGIMPDVFVPLDTNLYTSFYKQLMQKGITLEYSLMYLDQNWDVLRGCYNDFDDFKRNFEVKDNDLCDFNLFVRKKIKALNQQKRSADEEALWFNENAFENASVVMKQHIKALLAQHLWDTDQYIEIMNGINPVVIKGVEALNNEREYFSQLD